MRLDQWLKERNIRKYIFARMIGVTPTMVTEYCEGRIWPGRDKMQAIARETHGDVTANDFVQIEAAE